MLHQYGPYSYKNAAHGLKRGTLAPAPGLFATARSPCRSLRFHRPMILEGTPIGRLLRQAVGASHRAGARERPSGPARLALQQTPVLEPSMMFPAGFFRFWEPSRRFLNRPFLFQFLFRFPFFYFSSFSFFFFSVSFFLFLFSFPFFLFKFIFKKNPNFNFFPVFQILFKNSKNVPISQNLFINSKNVPAFKFLF